MIQDPWQTRLLVERHAVERRGDAAAYRLAKQARRPADAAGPASAVDLLTGVSEGDPAAWAALFREHSGPLARVARRCGLGAEDVADVVQQTWLKLVEKGAQIRDPECLRGWLLTTCRREALRLARENVRSAPHDAGDPSGVLCRELNRDQADNPVEVALRNDTGRIVRMALDDLPAHQARLLAELMRIDEGTRRAYATAAEALSMPVGGVGPTRLRALRRLRADPRLRALHLSFARP
ncbi:MAG TPA: sigma-70 family RNA polymerase sigma factor [Actinoplanes sp.]|nr:sigma-70 family RNA polymerase sigma factor [Actinoplanes sp.]